MEYHIARSYPDGVDEDYRIDGFDITGLGYRSIDDTIALYKAGHRFWSGTLLTRAEVVLRRRWDTQRDYLTTLPDNQKSNNLSSLAHPPSAIINALLATSQYPRGIFGGFGRLIK